MKKEPEAADRVAASIPDGGGKSEEGSEADMGNPRMNSEKISKIPPNPKSCVFVHEATGRRCRRKPVFSWFCQVHIPKKTELQVRKQFLDLAETAIGVLARIATDELCHERTRIQAANSILDRIGFSRSTEQNVTVERKGDNLADLSNEELMQQTEKLCIQLRAMEAKELPAGEVIIDVTPVESEPTEEAK